MRTLNLFAWIFLLCFSSISLQAQRGNAAKAQTAKAQPVVQHPEFKTNKAWTPDKAHTKFQFRATHLGLAETTGHFNDYDLDFHINEAHDFATAQFNLRIHTQSLFSGVEERDRHLKSKDFFQADEYPYMYFKSTQISPKFGGKRNEYTVEGDLTVRNITKPVTLVIRTGKPVIDPKGQLRLGFGGFGKISRRDFGMDFDIPLEDPEIEFISDEIRLDIGVEIIRQQSR